MYSPHKVSHYIHCSPAEDLGGNFSFEENHLKSPHEDFDHLGEGEA